MAGHVVLVDDLSVLKEGGWYINNIGYVARDRQSNNIRRRELLHRYIMGAKPNQMVDHIDGNKLNNRKSNLRFCTKAQNAMNSKVVKQIGVSGHRGIQWDKQRDKWIVRFYSNKQRIYGGHFCKIEDALPVRDKLYNEYHGKFARLEV